MSQLKQNEWQRWYHEKSDKGMSEISGDPAFWAIMGLGVLASAGLVAATNNGQASRPSHPRHSGSVHHIERSVHPVRPVSEITHITPQELQSFRSPH